MYVGLCRSALWTTISVPQQVKQEHKLIEKYVEQITSVLK